ncbi:MAG: hypothetical protein EDX89_22590 [Acidobacteria bacterium]|nr:MAG: hypothetical protein EDX89_22590 [Acidobacteriota bacterium]
MAFDLRQSAYEDFRSKVTERTAPLVAWVGAGLSVDAGLPDWRRLHQIGLEELKAKQARTDAGPDAAKLEGQYEVARREKSLWLGFELIERALGPTTFKEVIRRELSRCHSAPVPARYRNLWQLRLRGMISLNLDSLAARAFSEVHPGKPLMSFSGASVASHMHVLRGPHSFIASVHGVEADASTWVLTRARLKRLLGDDAYARFVSTILTNYTVLFVAVTADDEAVRTHLEKLSEARVDFGAHYWLTDRRDRSTDTWAEALGLRLIVYQNPDGRHAALGELFEDLHSHIPQDEDAPPVALPSAEPSPPLPPPEILLVRPAEEIRRTLNAHAARLKRGAEAAASMAELETTYDEAIHRAWYVTTSPPANKLLGYELLREVATGAFGHVFRATSPAGETVAIKLLRQDIRRRPEMLKSFRRGVQSMEILEKRHVPGVVPYRAASEIPAFVVMEFIEGPDLAEAVESNTKRLRDWSNVLRVASGLTRIIRAAHALPERVLHRDIRPENIMLPGFWEGEDWRVLVLDFDLSWHRGALEESVSVLPKEHVVGYLAPEQVEKREDVSTRNGLVDSFGLGMTFYFLATGRRPSFGQHRYRDWMDSVILLVRERGCKAWQSLPLRFARLILTCTRERQHERWDVSQILGELERLAEAARAPEDVRSAELLAEEIAARSTLGTGYVWDSDLMRARLSLPSGCELDVAGDESGSEVVVAIRWRSQGTEKWKHVTKYLPEAAQKAGALLRGHGWRSRSTKTGPGAAGVEVSVSVAEGSRSIKRLVDGLDAAARCFEFS